LVVRAQLSCEFGKEIIHNLLDIIFILNFGGEIATELIIYSLQEFLNGNFGAISKMFGAEIKSFLIREVLFRPQKIAVLHRGRFRTLIKIGGLSHGCAHILFLFRLLLCMIVLRIVVLWRGWR